MGIVSKAVGCIGCEGHPVAPNDPCALCGLASSPSPSMEMEATIRRLRDYRPPSADPDFGREHHTICDEAADLLSQAQSALAAMRAERDEAIKTGHEAFKLGVHHQSRADAAEAQVLRLSDENEALRKDAARDNKIINDLQGALAYWMPSVRPDTDEGLTRSAGDDAMLLFGHEGPEQGCWGDDMLAHIKALEEALADAADRLVFLGVLEDGPTIQGYRSALKENAP